eukprot:TRINITY_DN13082_c0_g1_i1.p1 TRINITY_DN13082_c0_g1~~TRINITY_DN13082_c0_g1_i1.p1  ORF type:complete len:634 (-),score=193.27 TRINITY_DN13082_c0_g1_i1:45-1910(-)
MSSSSEIESHSGSSSFAQEVSEDHSVDQSSSSLEEDTTSQTTETVSTAAYIKNKKAVKQKWIEVQKKAFLHWINSYLAQENIKIDDILDGFRDGVKLIVFLQLLTGEKITQSYTKKPKMRVHKITNNFIALKFLEELNVTGLTVAAEDLVDASEKNLKYILGFCWMLLRKFQNVPRRTNDGEDNDSPFESRLLEWIIDMTEEYDIKIENFSSLCDAKAIFALLEKYDKNIVNYSEIDFSDPLAAIKLALELAEEHLGVPSDILDPEELLNGTVSDKNLVLYSTLLHNSFQSKLENASKDSLVHQIKDLEVELKDVKEMLEEQKVVVEGVRQLHKDTVKEKDQSFEIKKGLEAFKEDRESQWQTEKKNLLSKIEQLKEDLETLKVATSGESEGLAKKNEARRAERDELIALKAELTAELEDLKEKKGEMQQAFDEARTERQALEDTVCKDQEDVGASIAQLSNRLVQHVENMNVLKVFQKQKTTYTSETIQALTIKELEEVNYEESLNAINDKLEAENDILKALFEEQLLILQETQKQNTFNRGNQKKERNIRKQDNPEIVVGKERKKKDKGEKNSARSERSEKSEKREKSDRSERKEKSSRGDKSDRSDRGDRKKRTKKNN